MLSGPNLNLLGEREPEVYGRHTLADIEAMVRERAEQLGVEVRFMQSNHEGVLLDELHRARLDCQAVVLNPGALTHTSIPVVEVHLSNMHAREPFRRRLVLAPMVRGQVLGFGPYSYVLGLEAAVYLARGGAR